MLEHEACPADSVVRTLNDASGRSYSRSYPVRRRSSSIRNSGGRSCWWRSRYSAISSSAFRIGSASTVAKKRRHTEKSPRLTAGASRDEEEAGMALSREPQFRPIRQYRGPYLKDVMAITKRRFHRQLASHSPGASEDDPELGGTDLLSNSWCKRLG